MSLRNILKPSTAALIAALAAGALTTPARAQDGQAAPAAPAFAIDLPAAPDAALDPVLAAPQQAQAPQIEAPLPVAEPPAPVVVETPAVAPAPQIAAPVPVEVELPPAASVVIAPKDVGPDPLALAMQDAIEQRLKAAPPAIRRGRLPAIVPAERLEMEAIAKYYAARNNAPVWRDGAGWTAAARSALTRVGRAGEDALDLSAYPAPALPTDETDPRRIADADLTLTRAVVAYGRQATGARINPRALHGLITPKMNVAEPAAILDAVARADDAGKTLQDFNPPHAGYRALRAKLAELRRDVPVAGRSAQIAPGRVLNVGMNDPRVPLIRARFNIGPNDDATLYDTKVADAVAGFQKSRGLNADGRLTPQTVAALAAGQQPGRLEAEIVANMERWRWLPRDLGASHLMVNVPEYVVRVVRDGQEVHSTRVIVGAPKTPSPIFSDKMQYMIVNPYWYVPPSIVREMGGDSANFSRRGYEVRSVRGQTVVRQPPGPRNALGYIKFLFPNDHAVYLHDTPARGLFASSRRAMSHGCIRVQNPFALAGVLMNGADGMTEARLKGMIGHGERTIHLPQHLPIHIAYFTAFVDETGQLRLLDDIYGHSRRVQAALGYRG